MSIIGKSSLSIRKADLQNQKVGASFTKITFAHKGAAGETGIDLTFLNTPSTEMPGFVQPSVAQLSEAKLKFFRKNLTLISSARGVLMDYVSYDVQSSTFIKFTESFGTALDGEIFIGVIDSVPRNGLVGVDTLPILSTGTLAATTTDYNVGNSFRVNANPNFQIGDIAVYLDGVLQFRNTANATAAPGADGNYQEVDAGGGSGTIVRFNQADPSNTRSVIVLNTGHAIIRPDGSLLDVLEATQGQVDKLVEVLSDVSGQPESYFQAAPNNVNLKAFGDRVFALESNRARIDTDNTWTAAQSLIGVIDGSSAGTGKIGETFFVSLATTSANSLVNNVAENIPASSITLSAGEWEISGAIGYLLSSATVTDIDFGISTTSNTLPSSSFLANPSAGQYAHTDYIGSTTLSIRKQYTIPTYTVSVTSPTTIYFVGRAAFSAGSVSAFGYYRAKRIR